MRTLTDTFTVDAARSELASGTRKFQLDGFEVELIETPAALDAVSTEWLALEQLSHHAAVFQSFLLLRVWARHFCSARGGGRLHVEIVRKDGRAVLILPLYVSGLPFMRVARIAGDPITQFSEILVDQSAEAGAAFEVALTAAEAYGIDAILLRRVRNDSNLLALAASRFRPAVNQSEAPFVDLSPFGDFPAFLASLSKNMRRSLRNRRNHLAKAGDCRFEILRGADARAAVAHALDLKRRWLVQRGALSSAFVDPATKACLLGLAESASAGAVIARLVVRGETAAIRFGIEYRGTHFAYMSAYDASFGDVAPGKLLMEFCIAGFRERQFERVDMLPPAGRHKNDWCPESTGVADYTLPLTSAGRLYAEVFQEKVRPAMKRTWARMPEAVRSLVAALFVRL